MTQDDFSELDVMLNDALYRMGEGARAFITSAVHTDRLKVWELFNRIPQAKRNPFVIRVYKYLNDNHVETALRTALCI